MKNKSIYTDYNIKKSSNPLKKYDVYKNGEFLLSFGAIKPNGEPYQQYKDKIGIYSKYDHLDKKRKLRYYQRHKINHPKPSSDYFAKRYLW